MGTLSCMPQAVATFNVAALVAAPSADRQLTCQKASDTIDSLALVRKYAVLLAERRMRPEGRLF